MWLARISGLLLVAVQIALSACSTAPVGARPRIIDVPLAAAQADIEFSIVSALRFSGCDEESACSGDEAQPFGQEVAKVAVVLQKAALRQYPDLAWCSPKASGGCFDVYLVEDDEPGSSSSANGRIALNEGLNKWGAQDGVLAFVLAREMGHVIARHHKERSAVSIVTSAVLNFLIPGSGALKSLLSTGGARLAAVSNQNVQATEADMIALSLLKGAGFRLRDISRSLVARPVSVDDNSWARDFGRSSRRLIAEAGAAEPTVAAAGGGKEIDRREVSANLPQ